MDRLDARIVGVLNCSPDSFSDGREYNDEAMRVRMLELADDGADWIDVGGESTAPGSTAVDATTELARLETFFRNRDALNLPFSVDTIKSKVALEGIRRGARMINDVSGGRHDPEMLALMSEHPDVRFVLMHSVFPDGRAERRARGEGDIIEIASRFFEERLRACEDAGMKHGSVILDPGMGAFLGTDPADSIRVIRSLDVLRERFGLPLYVGASRKGFLSAYTSDRGANDRLGSTLAATVAAILHSADYVRIHDVRALRQFRDVWNMICE
jgi:dihydropteroate synthase